MDRNLGCLTLEVLERLTVVTRSNSPEILWVWRFKWAICKVGGIKIFARSRKKKNIFVPNIAIFAPKYAFLCTHRPCRLIWYPVGWLVGGFGAKAALWIECLPSLLYFNFPAYYNLALCCWLLLCILKAFMVLKISQGLCSLYLCFLKPSLVL